VYYVQIFYIEFHRNRNLNTEGMVKIPAGPEAKYVCSCAVFKKTLKLRNKPFCSYLIKDLIKMVVKYTSGNLF
jgi:hypothetical protein